MSEGDEEEERENEDMMCGTWPVVEVEGRGHGEVGRCC